MCYMGERDQGFSGMDQPTDPLLAETSMADKSRDQSKAKKEDEKKPTQPVELTDDQIQAVIGGASQPPPNTGGSGGGGVQPN
jgi:hypothetical protein